MINVKSHLKVQFPFVGGIYRQKYPTMELLIYITFPLIKFTLLPIYASVASCSHFPKTLLGTCKTETIINLIPFYN